MAYDIGPKIGIDGEAEFRKQINNINTNIRTLGTEMKAVTSAFDANDRSQEALTAQSKVLTKQVDAQEQKLEALRSMLEKCTEKYGENDEKTQKWQQAVNNATADLNKMRRQLVKNAQDLENLGKEVDDVDDALEEAEKGVGAFDIALGNLAANAVSALASAVVDLVGQLWELDESTRDYRREMGMLETAFINAGYGAKEAEMAYQGMFALLGDSSTATEASQLLASVATSTEDINSWITIATGAMGVFGDALPTQSLIEAANETAKTGEIVGALADALNWAGVSEDAFAESLAQLNTTEERTALITDTLVGLYSDAADAYEDINGSVMEAYENQAKLTEVMGTLGAAVEGLKNSLMSMFMPALQTAGNGVAALFNKLTSAAQEISNGGDFVQVGVKMLTDLLRGIITNLPKIAEAATQIIVTLINSLSAEMKTLVPIAIEAVMTVVQGILDNLGLIIEAGIELVLAVALGIIEALPQLAEKMPEIIITIINVISDNLPLIVAAAVQIMGALIIGLIQSIPKLIEAVPDIVVALVKAFADMGKEFLEIGKNMILGIWEGIKSMAKWLKDKVVGMFTGFIDDIKVIFGIHSPSRVFEKEIGAMLAQGIGVGFMNEMDGVSAMMQNSIPTPQISLADVAAGMVNGVQTAMTGAGGSYRVEIPLYIDGKEFYRATLDDLRSVMRANPVPV